MMGDLVSFMGSVPAEWRGPVVALMLIALVLGAWPVRRGLAAALLARLSGGVAPAPSPALDDSAVWRELDITASGLPIPIICIDRDHRVRIYNRAAEDATGHPWNAAHGADVGLLLTDADAAALRRDLDSNLRDRHATGGAALRLVGVRRAVHLERPDGGVRSVVLRITDFGNGHGGWQMSVEGGVDGAATIAA